MSRTTSGMLSRDSSDAWMTTSTPSPNGTRSASVTRAAISISASFRRSSPVISQSIHTRRALTRPTLTAHEPPGPSAVDHEGCQQAGGDVLDQLEGAVGADVEHLVAPAAGGGHRVQGDQPRAALGERLGEPPADHSAAAQDD